MLEVVFLLVWRSGFERGVARVQHTLLLAAERGKRGIRFVPSRRVFHSSQLGVHDPFEERRDSNPWDRKIRERCDEKYRSTRIGLSIGIGITHEDVRMISRRISIDLYSTVSFEFSLFIE